jgi:hypothetical protein
MRIFSNMMAGIFNLAGQFWARIIAYTHTTSNDVLA